MTNHIQDLVLAIAGVGKDNPSHPLLHRVEPFRHFLLPDGRIDYAHLDERDGSCTRREVLIRFLLLSAVIDQGPDVTGVRELLVGVTNDLYRREVRFLHKPLSFFAELGLAIDQILDKHESVKTVRAVIWARENLSKASKYNLFMDSSKQVLNYAVFRWGVPLAVPLLLEKDDQSEERGPTVLLDYLESWQSAEEMSQQIKDHERYGLGKAIGDKACHLFAKWMVSVFRLTRRKELSWGDFSFEVPYDSNAGRVLWRTGFLLKWAKENDYIERKVIQPGKGKRGADYIRVTNVRGMKVTSPLPERLRAIYSEVAVNHLRSHRKSPRKVEIQRVQHAYLLEAFPITNLDVADFDDGLIHIGTRYCFNHPEPLCGECPINSLCEGYQSNRRLILNFRT
jgi:hypothetical protein